MYLALQVTSPNAAALGPAASRVFGEGGGTIGRAATNDWVLPDPERYISSRHAIIRYMNSMFSLEDVSVNGVFINGQPEPVGAGNDPVILRNGDRIQIGDYEMYASIVDEVPAAPGPAQAPVDPLITSPTGSITSPTSPTAAPTASGGTGASTIGPVDPLEMLNDAPAPPPAEPPAYPDHSSATSDYFAPPGPSAPPAPSAPGGQPTPPGGIPDDWDLTEMPRAQPAAPPEPAYMPPPAEPPPAAAPTPQPQADATGQVQAMAPPPPSAAGATDELMMLIVQGMMDILRSRTDIKSQFRLELTSLKPVSNNPLKFSPTAQEAMGHLFSGASSSYLPAAQAFEEGFNDIKAHQMAMIAGMRAAFEHMLEQFSPDVLEDRFSGGSKRGGLMNMANKVRYWDMYSEMFERISRDSDDNFRELFGEAFATAYERQMQRITNNR